MLIFSSRNIPEIISFEKNKQKKITKIESDGEENEDKEDEKEEYIERYKERGNQESFIKLLEDNWNNWIKECKEQENCFKVELEEGQFITDVLKGYFRN